ncbi:hypothetical protein SDC9_195723 [bioreactor metagenome]|uniref:Uncharacterized protein n=1 Tax=bioreactor metagenome TaxID=1076179 RepID=A0A645ICD4_9ZZZZ
MLPAFLKDHLGVHLSGPGQHDSGAPQLKRGGGPLHAGKGAFLIAQQYPARDHGQRSLGGQLRAVRVAAVEILLSPDGEDDRQRRGLSIGQCQFDWLHDANPPAKTRRRSPRNSPPGR